MQDCVVRDAMTWICLIKNNIQGSVCGTIDQFQTLVRVLVHDNWHAGNKGENGRYRYLTVISLTQDHKGFLLRGFAIFPLMLRNEDPKRRLLLLLERECAFEIQIPAIL